MARWNRLPLDLRTRMLAFLFPLGMGIGWLFAVLPDGPWWAGALSHRPEPVKSGDPRRRSALQLRPHLAKP